MPTLFLVAIIGIYIYNNFSRYHIRDNHLLLSITQIAGHPFVLSVINSYLLQFYYSYISICYLKCSSQIKEGCNYIHLIIKTILPLWQYQISQECFLLKPDCSSVSILFCSTYLVSCFFTNSSTSLEFIFDICTYLNNINIIIEFTFLNSFKYVE